MNSSYAQATPSAWQNPAFKKRLSQRHRAEKRFRLYGIAAIVIGLSFVIALFASIAVSGTSAFWQTQIRLNIYFDPEVIDAERLNDVNYATLVRTALYSVFPEITSRKQKRELRQLVSIGSDVMVQKMVRENPGLIGASKEIWFPVDDVFDTLHKTGFGRDAPAAGKRLISEQQLEWFDLLLSRGIIKSRFNKQFFTAGDSREPELAGLRGALTGSFFTILVALLISFPVGVATACYLEEFAPKNRVTDIIEVNINNLAAVPSVVFGLLGLAVFIGFFGLPRSVPLVGGLVLSLMTIPTIIIASRAALRAVPPSIREGALALGASKTQTVVQEVVPLAMPGMLTGTIIGLAQALGETAPLLMIGMVAFIVDIPASPLDPSTVLPVQIYLWADSPERAFLEKTSGAILILLVFLITMNILAVWLRKRFESRW